MAHHHPVDRKTAPLQQDTATSSSKSAGTVIAVRYCYGGSNPRLRVNRGAFMGSLATEQPPGRQAAWVAGALVIAFSGTSSEARKHKVALAKTHAQAAPARLQQRKPIKLRYFGGPKFPMFPE
jgi:hypothetical protein